MSATSSGVNNGTTFSYTASYTELYATHSGGVTTWKINLTTSSGGSGISALAWVRSDGTVLAVDYGGQNLTGSTAQSILAGAMIALTIEETTVAQLSAYTGTNFHTINTTTVTLGSVTMSVTNYGPNTTPVTFSYCGTTFTITSAVIQVGTVPGTHLALVTVIRFKGTLSGGGTSSNLDYVLKITSLTKA